MRLLTSRGMCVGIGNGLHTLVFFLIKPGGGLCRAGVLVRDGWSLVYRCRCGRSGGVCSFPTVQHFILNRRSGKS